MMTKDAKMNNQFIDWLLRKDLLRNDRIQWIQLLQWIIVVT